MLARCARDTLSSPLQSMATIPSRSMGGDLLDPVAFVGSVLLLVLHVLFYLALTLLLGTLVQSSGPVAGIALGSLLGGLMVQDRLAQLARVMPWVLPGAAGLHATQ